MSALINRRRTLKTVALGLTSGALVMAGSRGAEALQVRNDLIPPGAKTLQDLTQRLAKAPRRRNYKTMPMISTAPDQWDYEALAEVIAYRGSRKQVWDNVDLGGPWLNLMRNAVNAQVWSFRHPDYLCVSATHASAHLALYDDTIWEKYQLTKQTDGKFKSNTLITEPDAHGGLETFEAADGLFSSKSNRIPVLQRRGVVFLSCHNAIWELAARLCDAGINPDHLSVEAVTADLTNHLIPGVVATPGAVATLVELQAAGFGFGK